jgi:hypothetical protein
MVYLMSLSVTQNYITLSGRKINDKLEKMWKEALA